MKRRRKKKKLVSLISFLSEGKREKESKKLNFFLANTTHKLKFKN